MEMEYVPNQHLQEEVLANELGVSRTPLRQALSQLEMEGLVIKKSNGRIHVSPITMAEVEEVYKVREVLEGLIAREAALKLTAEEIQQLRDIVTLMSHAASEHRIPDTLKYGSQFHHYLHIKSKNSISIRLLQQINGHIERFRRISGYKHPHYEAKYVVQEHQTMLEHLEKREAAQVEEAMRAHIRRSLQTTLETLSFLEGLEAKE